MKYTAIFFMLVSLVQCKPTEPKTTSTAHLENTYWRLTEMNGEPLKTPENQREVHIVLAKDGNQTRLQGFAGCNNMGGNYTVNHEKIKFTVIATKMMCEGGMETENYLFGILDKADNYQIEGERLKLYQGKTLIGNFESVYLK
jgi:heat shock protein HslJ